MASRSALNGIALVPESFHVDVVVNLLVPDCSSQITSALYPFFSITLSVQVITPVEEIDISGDIDVIPIYIGSIGVVFDADADRPLLSTLSKSKNTTEILNVTFLIESS